MEPDPRIYAFEKPIGFGEFQKIVSPLSYSYCVPLSVPYWKGATYRGILRSFFSGRVIEGPDLGKLRTAVIERLGVEEAILCGSGSLALEIALRACGVREGDEVIVPTFCCTSVVTPIFAVGARPVLADVGEELNITAETVEAALTKNQGDCRTASFWQSRGHPGDHRSRPD
jgi:dTDP-4-amino-4,6-dideoxygalactose transaminase